MRSGVAPSAVVAVLGLEAPARDGGGLVAVHTVRLKPQGFARACGPTACHPAEGAVPDLFPS